MYEERDISLVKKHKIDIRNFSSGNYLIVLKKSNEILNSVKIQIK